MIYCMYLPRILPNRGCHDGFCWPRLRQTQRSWFRWWLTLWPLALFLIRKPFSSAFRVSASGLKPRFCYVSPGSSGAQLLWLASSEVGHFRTSMSCLPRSATIIQLQSSLLKKLPRFLAVLVSSKVAWKCLKRTFVPHNIPKITFSFQMRAYMIMAKIWKTQRKENDNEEEHTSYWA